MAASPLSHLKSTLVDPFGFTEAFRGLSLAPEDLPSLTRDCRMAGYGC